MDGPRRNGYERGDGIPSSIRLLEKDGIKSTASTPEELDTATIRQMTFQNIRQNIQQMQSSLMEEVEEKLTEMIGKVVEEMEQSAISEKRRYILVDDGEKYRNRVKPNKNGALSEKQFMARNSLLTDLFEVKHIQTIYNIFLVILIILFMNTAVQDLIVGGKSNLGLNLIWWNFQGIGTVIFIWFGMMASVILLFSCFNLWAHQRTKWVPHTLGRKCWDYGWLTAFILYEVLLLILPAMKVMETFIPPASSSVLLLEQVRLMMKTYAFVRSNVPRALAYKPHQSGDEKDASPCPGFSKYLYFLFVPTIVYKDNYPRTKEIRWKYVVWCFVEVIGVVFYLAFVFERFLIPIYQDFGKPGSQKSLAQIFAKGMFDSMMPGTLSFLCAFYCLLHSWMNAFAEMLQFADRMFYKDWWNAKSHSAYYRLWNIVVHDWLYTYVYKDLNEVMKPGNRWVATVVVFFVSAIFHEYILALVLGFCYPMLFVAFAGFGVSLVFLTKDCTPGGNIFVWLIIASGIGVLLCLYGFEWYARINCPQILDPFWDFFVPRSWTCTNI